MKDIKKEIQQAIKLYKSHKFSEAELLSKKLIKLNPKIFFLYNLLGLILTGQGKNDESIKYYKRGISIKPDYAMIYNNLGNAYKAKKDYPKAENYYNKSVKLNNKLPEVQNNLGNLYIDLNKYTEAIISFKKSISINSSFYIAHYNLGILYKSIGKFEESKKCFNKAIRLNPQFCSAHRAFSQINKYEFGDDHIYTMKKLYEKKDINTSDKIELAYGLGKAFDDIKNFEDAFKYYKEGNTLRRKNIKFSIAREREEFLNIKKIFNKAFFNKYKKIGNENSSPIFILGMPRSGTTLVEQIISNHPKVYGGDELNFFNDYIKNHFYKNGNFSREYINRDNEKNFKKIGQEYINKIKKISGKSDRITDKLPINFKWIGFIKLILPKAKIVHCIRNSRDTCLSIYKNYFTNTELNYAYDLDELVEFYNLYVDLMNFWRKNLSKFIIEIKYEGLVKNPKKEITNLIKNCDLTWNENCMKFYNNKRVIKTASDSQARNKLYESSINSWKNYEKYLKKTLEKLEN